MIRNFATEKLIIFNINQIIIEKRYSVHTSQCDDQICNCYKSNFAQLNPYGVEADLRGQMTCSCARDEDNNMSGDRSCAGNGDYKTLQTDGSSHEFCADPTDGWRVS